MTTAHEWTPTDNFGNRLVVLRNELGLTIEEAAERCGIKRATWRTWELGISTPRKMADVVDKIAQGLVRDGAAVDRNYLMWGSRTPGFFPLAATAA